MNLKRHLGLVFGVVASLAIGAAQADAAPLKIGYSDWPGWVAWQIAIDKGWFKQAGVDVKFEWFDYSASLDAFAAGKLDGILITNGDTLVIGAGGAKGVMVMLTDYSSGNDQVIAKPGITSIKGLKGQKVGVEVGLVDHLLLMNALETNGMGEKDITLVNTKTNDTPQVLKSGQVAAVACWEPSAGQARAALPGAKAIYTSSQAPGLIYDVLSVSPKSIATNRADWVKITKIWDRVVKYVADPKTQTDAVKIMSARDGLTPAAYKAFLAGTHLLDLKAGAMAYMKGPKLSSIYGSTVNADKFNLKYAVYKTSQKAEAYIDPSITEAAIK